MVAYLNVVLGQRLELSCGWRIQKLLEEPKPKVILQGSPTDEAFQIRLRDASDGVDTESNLC